MAQALILVAAALAFLALAGGVAMMALGDRAFATRIAIRTDARFANSAAARQLGQGILARAIGLLSRWGETAGRGAIEKDKRSELRLRLIQGGFYAERSVEVFFGIRATGAALLGAGGVIVAHFAHAFGSMGPLAGLMIGGNLGLFLPNLLLGRRIAERRRAVQRGLPDALDLMVVSVEAGATLTASLQRVVAEFRALHPILAEQFGLMLMEMQAGASRAEALNRMAQRSGSEEMRALVTMLIQSDAVGASIADTLRVLSDELRRSRYLEAERKAAELPVKLSFPLVLCIFPCLVGVIFIPTAIRILRMSLHF